MSSLETPFPYQLVGAQWLATMPQALLADEMGLGKSAQTILAADMVGAKDILVVCPASVRINWEREFERFSPMDRPCTVLMSGKDKVPAAGVVVCSYDMLQAFSHVFKARAWDVLVLDEAHYLKERSAQRTKAVYGRGAKWPGLAASAKRVWRLTGTPAPNDASELWTHLKSMGVTQSDYWDFTFRYCSGFDSNYGFKITGHKNVEELKGILKTIMLRRKKEEVLTELPPITFHHVTVDRSHVDLDPVFFEQLHKLGPDTVEAQNKFYGNLKVADTSLRQALAAVASSGRPNEARLGLLESMGSSLGTLRRYIGMSKLPACVDIIKEDLDANPDMKIVIFAVHMSVIEEARLRLAKYGAVTLYGGTPAAKRQQNIDKFQKNPKCRVFIGNVQAAGVGITLTAANQVVFIEQSWVPADNAQAAMRCHRIGQTKHVHVRIMSLHKSVDEQVNETLTRKTRELTKLDF